MSAVERGKNFPSFEVLLGLARLLDVDPNAALEVARLAGRRTRVAGAGARPADVRWARDLAQAGDHLGAAIVYERILSSRWSRQWARTTRGDRDPVLLELEQARCLVQCGRLETARAAARRILTRHDPGAGPLAWTYLILAEIEIRLGCLRLALDHVLRAEETLPGSDDELQGRVLLEKGRILLAAGKPEQARRALLAARSRLRLVEHASLRAEAEANLGRCWTVVGHADRARGWFRRALLLAMRNRLTRVEADGQIGLARLDLRAGRLEAADRNATLALILGREAEDNAAVFRAEWLRHLVRLARSPGAGDARRLKRLRRLAVTLHAVEGAEELAEFREKYG